MDPPPSTANIKCENEQEGEIDLDEHANFNSDEENCATCEDVDVCDCEKCKGHIKTEFDEENNLMYVEISSDEEDEKDEDDEVIFLKEVVIKKEVTTEQENGIAIAIEKPCEPIVKGNYWLLFFLKLTQKSFIFQNKMLFCKLNLQLILEKVSSCRTIYRMKTVNKHHQH